jgi:hypothetical protein
LKLLSASLVIAFAGEWKSVLAATKETSQMFYDMVNKAKRRRYRGMFSEKPKSIEVNLKIPMPIRWIRRRSRLDRLAGTGPKDLAAAHVVAVPPHGADEGCRGCVQFRRGAERIGLCLN